MSDGPKKIWAAECRATNSTMWWPDDAGGVGTEYTRTDHVQTLIAEAVAAEREACAREAEGKYKQTSMLDPESPFYGTDMSPDRSDWGRGIQRGRAHAAAAIRARTDADDSGEG